MNEEDNDEPIVPNVFSRRANLLPQVSVEEFNDGSKLIEEIKKNNYESPPEIPRIHSGKRKATSKVPKHIQTAKIKSLSSEENDKRSRRAKRVEPPKEKTPFENLLEKIDKWESDDAVSAVAKRNIIRLKNKHEMELRSIEAANQKVLSALDTPDTEEVTEVDDDKYANENLKVLNVSYFSDISRLKCYEDDKFSTIFPKIADLFKLKVSEFLLCLREKTIKVDDTPKSLNIGPSDILECIPYKPSADNESDYDENKLKIFFQSNDSKVKTEMVIHKLEKMEDVMERYSKTRNIPLSTLEFEFDGEKISGSESAEDLDMESGNCIDVHVMSSEKELDRRTLKRRKDAATPVVTLDSDSNDSDILLSD